MEWASTLTEQAGLLWIGFGAASEILLKRSGAESCLSESYADIKRQTVSGDVHAELFQDVGSIPTASTITGGWPKWIKATDC